MLDHRDDNGLLLKRFFPTIDSVPETIKQAWLSNIDNLPNEAFALIAIDGPNAMRKYACHDAGTTLVSSIYFLECGAKLPEQAQKTAAANLVAACKRFEIDVPPALEKAASLQGAVAGVVNITSGPQRTKVASPRPENAAYFALEFEGKNMFPIDTHENIKLAEAYWLENERRFHPAHRREFAVKLAARADDVAVRVDERIKVAGGSDWASEAVLEDAISKRKHASLDEDNQRMLGQLLEIRESIGQEKYASALLAFDINTGLDKKWGAHIPDPYISTYGFEKTAEIVYDKSDVRLSRFDLESLVNEHASELAYEVLTTNMTDGMEKDPVAWFKKLPPTLQHLIARLATDVARKGHGVSQMPDPPASIVQGAGTKERVATKPKEKVASLLNLALAARRRG